MNLELSLNRRQLFRAAAVAAASSALVSTPVFAQTADLPSSGGGSADAPDAPAAVASPAKQPTADSPAPPAASATDKSAPQTGEGAALADAALATAGHTLSADMAAEVRKQLGSYPGSYREARKFELANGDAPHFGVTPQNP